MSRGEWAREFLVRIGAPITHRNLLVLMAWMQAEGGTARWNPLNSTHDAPGATIYNWASVKNYPSFEVGMQATVETLNWGADRRKFGYRRIRRRLRKSRGSTGTLKAIERSEWGTDGLALVVLPDIKREFNENAKKTISGS